MLVGSYSVASLGQFNLAWRCLEVPLALINAAVGQVFFHKLATLRPGQMRPLVRQVIKRVLIIGTAPFVLLYIVSPWLFPLLFGSSWTEAGSFARALTPWLFILLVTSPLSTLFVVTENQDWLLMFSVVYAAVPLAWLWFSPYSLLTTTYVLGALMCLILVVQILMADAAARQLDFNCRCACVYAVFDDFFQGVGGAFDHFAGGDLVDEVVGQGGDSGHGFLPFSNWRIL